MTLTIDRYLESVLAARRAGTPLIAIECPDPAATVQLLRKRVIREDAPIITWDSIRGWLAANDAGRDAISRTLDTAKPDEISARTGSPLDCLREAAALPPSTVLFMFGAHRVISPMPPSTAEMAQAAWNLRDMFKENQRTLILLGPGFILPMELSDDVFTIEEPYPGEPELRQIVTEICEADRLAIVESGGEEPAPPSEEELGHAVAALRGIAAFPAEQAVAMSVNGKLNIDELWERKRRKINDTPGLSIFPGLDRLADIGGNENIKQFIREMIAGEEMADCVVFVDEIEKSMAGATGSFGDSSGTTQGQLQQFLVWMQDMEVAGLMLTGVAGTGKSAIAKAIGGEAGVPTIAMDLGGFKSSYVGSTEARMRAGLRTINAVAGGKGRVLVVATCNRISSLPPELKRRFQFGTFFFDLPDHAERDAIWTLYLRDMLKRSAAELDLEATTGAAWRSRGELPEENDWTGAEIKACCMIARRLRISLSAAAKYIVPVAKSGREAIEELRRGAEGRFVSASHEGYYKYPGGGNASANPSLSTRRKMSANKEMN